MNHVKGDSKFGLGVKLEIPSEAQQLAMQQEMASLPPAA